MSKPSHQQMQSAITAAERLRAAGPDEEHLAHVFLYLQRRDEILEQVLHAIEHYLHSGQDSQAHSRLLRAVEAAHRQEWQESSEQRERRTPFGLE
jgi:hypothetical protein